MSKTNPQVLRLLFLALQVASILHHPLEPRASRVATPSSSPCTDTAAGSGSGNLRRCNEPPSQLLGFRFRDSMTHEADASPPDYRSPSLSAQPKAQWQAQRPLDYILASIGGARERLQNSEKKLAEHSSQPAAISMYGQNQHHEWSKSDTIKRIHSRS